MKECSAADIYIYDKPSLPLISSGSAVGDDIDGLLMIITIAECN